MVGRDDTLIPLPYLECRQESVPHAQTCMVDEAGHMLPYEQPEAVEQVVTACLG